MEVQVGEGWAAGDACTLLSRCQCDFAVYFGAAAVHLLLKQCRRVGR